LEMKIYLPRLIQMIYLKTLFKKNIANSILLKKINNNNLKIIMIFSQHLPMSRDEG